MSTPITCLRQLAHVIDATVYLHVQMVYSNARNTSQEKMINTTLLAFTPMLISAAHEHESMLREVSTFCVKYVMRRMCDPSESREGVISSLCLHLQCERSLVMQTFLKHAALDQYKLLLRTERLPLSIHRLVEGVQQAYVQRERLLRVFLWTLIDTP